MQQFLSRVSSFRDRAAFNFDSLFDMFIHVEIFIHSLQELQWKSFTSQQII